jgi:hypothetical protein
VAGRNVGLRPAFSQDDQGAEAEYEYGRGLWYIDG